MLKKYLIMISLMTAFNLMGQNIYQKREISLDTEGKTTTKGEKFTIEQLEKERAEKYDNSQTTEETGDAFTANEEEPNAITTSHTRTSEYFNYLTGIDLADLIVDLNNDGDYCDTNETIFDNVNDCLEYAIKIKNRYYIPQGLTSFTGGLDTNRYLLISAYYYDNNGVSDHAVVIKFKPYYLSNGNTINTNRIVKIYKLTSSDLINNHVGGIGFHRYWYLSGYTFGFIDIIFLTDDTKIRAYNMTSTALIPLTINNSTYFQLPNSPIIFNASYLSVKDGYLWVGMFDENENNMPLNGYSITATTTNITLNLKYELKVPKQKLQGIYSVTNPSIDKRLMFYLTNSYGDDESYKYHAILDAKDLNNDGVIREGEYKWESIFTPFNDISQTYYNGLPAGAEGITKLDGNTYLANEGATYKYIYEKGWSKAVRKLILTINPLYFTLPEIRTVDMDNAGSIVVNGSSIDSTGGKVIVVLAQNKQGNFYYSMGELNYQNSIKLKVFLNKPATANPVNYQASVNKKPSVFAEDIKGIYLMNFDASANNSDDWLMTSVDIHFDDNEFSYVNNSDSIYTERVNIIDTELGDDSTDKKGVLVLFNTNYSSDYSNYQAGIYYNQSYQDLYDLYSYMNQCYYNNSSCFTSGESYIQTERVETFCNNIDNNLNNSYFYRLTNIFIDFCN